MSRKRTPTKLKAPPACPPARLPGSAPAGDGFVPPTPAKSERMVFDLSAAVQMAIRLRSVKDNLATGAVVERAVRAALAVDVAQAEAVLRGEER